MGSHGTPMFHGLGSFMYAAAVRLEFLSVSRIQLNYLVTHAACCRLHRRRVQTGCATHRSHSGRRLAGLHRYGHGLLMERALLHRGKCFEASDMREGAKSDGRNGLGTPNACRT